MSIKSGNALDIPPVIPLVPEGKILTRILLVNDHSDIRALLVRHLQLGGYSRVVEAKDGNAAIQHLRDHNIDLLITDIHMPYLDGWRLARMVRSGLFACPANTPILAVSATFSERIAETTAREFQINRFLSMPFKERHELVATIKTLLGHVPIGIKKPNLLIIEDDPDTAYLAGRMLHHRFETELAVDGLSGLEAWRSRRHELVLLDAMLPKLAGSDVLREIVSDDPDQAVVIMTADGSRERCESLMLSGAVDFVPKPFQADQLRQICDMAVRRNDCLISNQQFHERTRTLNTVQGHYLEISAAHQRLLDHLSTVVFELDKTGRLLFLNLAWEQLSQYKLHECLDRHLYDFFHPVDRSSYRSILNSLTLGRKQRHEQEVRLLSKAGDTLWVKITLDIKYDAAGNIEAIYGHLVDITDRKLAMERLEHLAIHDSLTGLYNRRYFEISLDHLVAGSARTAGPHALLYIDLDHFQMVNDTISHRDGDTVLREVSQLLAARTREADLLCRIGGDEFAMLLTHTNAQQAVAVATSVIEVLNSYRYGHDEQQIPIGCSIGISIIGGGQPSGTEHLIRADKASFVAKNRGRNLVHIYDPADKDNEELKQGIDWAHRIRQAIQEESLELHVQPILEISTGKVNHYEALLRLHAPNPENVVGPGMFIPMLEKAGQIHLLDRWVIKRAIELLSLHPSLHNLAINLSGRAFADPGLIAFIRDRLQEQPVDPRRIIFEITETASVANVHETQRMFHQLLNLGCRFALDDFGTGFCSFHYLRHLPADYLKLDGSYIRNIATNDIDHAMVRSMNEIAHTLGKKTIAECVENAAVLQCLQEIGVDYVQGHQVGRVLSVEEYII